jgi:ferrous iron transport protein B
MGSIKARPCHDSAGLTLAIIGSPNCGKTTLFNGLTGSRYKVANYPGVTVERRQGACGDITLLDLPGIYSLGAVSPDEQVTTKVVFADQEDVAGIVLVLDATCLERQLYLASQVLDLGMPTLVVLSMMDLAEQHGICISTETLSRRLGVPVVVSPGWSKLEQIRLELEHFARTLPLPSFSPHVWCSLDSFHEYAERLGRLEFSSGSEEKARSRGYQLFSGVQQSTNAETQDLLAVAREALVAQGVDPSSFEATSRYRWVRDITAGCIIRTEANLDTWECKIDYLVTHRLWGAVIFFLVLASLFQVVFQISAIPMGWVEAGIEYLGQATSWLLGSGLLASLVVDGGIMGVGNVLVFVPQIAALFFLLSLLEESGYLARAAHVMDLPMRAVGLQGRSFVPMLNSFACAIPGIMATRTIPSYGDRLTTIMVAPLMSCSARLPVYTVLIGALIPPTLLGGVLSLQGVVLLVLYLMGIAGAALVAFVLKKTLLRGEPALFILELPRFRRPSLRTALRTSLDKSLSFIRSAGTVILACSILLWALASFPRGVPIEQTYAGQVGKVMEPVMSPLGYNWEISIGILSSFVAREVFVTALATVYNLGEEEGQAQSLSNLLKERRMSGEFPLATGCSLLVFYVFACQCMSTLAVVKSETGSYTWAVFMFLYLSVLAYASAWGTYNLFRWSA